MVDAGDALAAGAVRVHDEMPDNLAFDYEYGNRAATEQGFAKAAHVVRVESARAADRRQSDGAEVLHRAL